MMAWSRETWKFYQQFLRGFFGKTTHFGKIFKVLFRKFSRLIDWHCCWNVEKICLMGNHHALFTLQQKQNFGSLSNCHYCAYHAENLPGLPPTFGSQCSTFHPNQFTFGGFITKHAKAVLWTHRVFARFAFGRIKIKCCAGSSQLTFLPSSK